MIGFGIMFALFGFGIFILAKENTDLKAKLRSAGFSVQTNHDWRVLAENERNEARDALDLAITERDGLLARVMFDDANLETTFATEEEAQEFLARRSKAMEALGKVMAKVDLSGPEWADDHVPEPLSDSDRQELEEMFVPKKTEPAIPWFKPHTAPTDGDDEGKI